MESPHRANCCNGNAPPIPLPPRVLQALADAMSHLRFGTIQLTVHEGRVVQLDVTERQRFT